MNNFDYKQIFYYTPPVLILVLIFGYYWAIKDIPRVDILNRNTAVVKTEGQAAIDAFNKNDFAGANKIIDEMLAADKNNIAALLLKARSLAQEGSLSFKEKELGNQALLFIERALLIHPKNVEAITLKGYVYEIQQDYVKAHKYFDEALAIDPNNVETLTQKAHAYYLQSNDVEAKRYYDAAISLDPKALRALSGLASIYVQENELEKAKNIYIQIGESSENVRLKAEGYYSAAFVTTEIDSFRIEDVEILNDKAILADPSYAPPLILKSKLLFAQSVETENEESKTNLIRNSFGALEKAIQINPNQSLAHLQLAIQLNILGDTDNFKKIINKLPSIIEKDITLSTEEKESVKKVVAKLLAENK